MQHCAYAVGYPWITGCVEDSFGVEPAHYGLIRLSGDGHVCHRPQDIGVTTFIAWRNQSAELALRESRDQLAHLMRVTSLGEFTASSV